MHQKGPAVNKRAIRKKEEETGIWRDLREKRKRKSLGVEKSNL